MPRKNLIRSNTSPYHVTYRVNNREWFKLPMPEMWDLVSHELLRVSIVCGLQIHAFTLMDNHLHLLATTPIEHLDKAMAEFASALTRAYNRITGRSGHLFGGRYYWTIILSPLHYAYVLKYVYRNPVRAKLCERVQDYPYSSLYGLLGSGRLPFPIHYPIHELPSPAYSPVEIWAILDWLNQPFEKELLSALDSGLKKRTLALPEQLPE